MSRFVSFLVLIAILVVSAIIFFQVMAAFLVPLFLAALLGVVVQPLYRWTLEKCRGYRHIAAGITTFLVAVIVLLPIGMVITTATLEGISLVDRLQLGDVRQRLDKLRADFGLQIPRETDIDSIEAVLGNWRDKQRQGEPLKFDPDQVKSLIARVENIEKWLNNQKAEGALVISADPAPLKAALQQLLAAEDAATAPPPFEAIDSDSETAEPVASAIAHTPEDKSVRQEDALLVADAEFRDFKRNLLGGTYRAWLTEWANPSDEQVEQLSKSIFATARPVLSFGGDTAVQIAKIGFGTLITIVALFFLLAEGEAMLKGLIQISPLEEQHVRELVKEFDRACRAIVSATLLSAIAQGLLAGIGFYICGLRSSVALLTLLTMVLALVPFTGAAAVWIPVALWLYFYQGSLTAALGLAAYGTFVISASDNVIKPLVLHGQSKLHPLLALLSVLGGIQALGPIGIVVGPMAVVFLQTLLRILQRELMSMDRSSWMVWPGFTGFKAAAAASPAAAASSEIVTSAAGSVDVGPSPPPPASPGNGHAGGNQAKPKQQSGKKRRR